MTNGKIPADPIDAVASLVCDVNAVRCKLRQADTSLKSALKLLNHPPKMSGLHRALAKGNLVSVRDLTGVNPNARDAVSKAKDDLEASIEVLGPSPRLIRTLIG